MDRKTILVIIICTAVVIGYNVLYLTTAQKRAQEQRQSQPPAPTATQQQQPVGDAGTGAVTAPIPPLPRPERPQVPEQTYTLKTSLQEIEFTTHGAAIKKITLLPRLDGTIRDPLVLDAAPAPPLMAIDGLDGLHYDTAFELIEAESSGTQVVFQTKSDRGLVVRKIYSVAGDYRLKCKLTIQNADDAQAAGVAPYSVSIGTARSLNGESIYDQPGIDWFDGKVPRYDVTPTWFDAGRFLFLFETHGPRNLYSAAQERPNKPVVWAATKNQYFSTIVTPQQPAIDLKARRVDLPVPAIEKAAKTPPHGVTASLVQPGMQVSGGQPFETVFHLFAGPKEFKLLMALSKEPGIGNNQHEVMQLGVWIGPIARLLLRTMLWLNVVAHNYGVAIVILTIIIKIIFWPVTGASMRSMKRMQKVQPLMAALKEKFKDDPQRMNQEMMKMYREHKVNPLGGCLPMLIQIPVFFGLFSMLKGAIELRGASFLWVKDLSQPDTLFTIPGLGLPFNPLPLLMVGTMIWQQKITPTTVDPKQAKLMMLMPLIMLLFFYTASSGLALYWTVQQILSVGQQYWMNAQKDKDEPQPAKPAKAKKK